MESPCLHSLKTQSYRANLLRLPFGPLAGRKAKLSSPETEENHSAVKISAHWLDSDQSMGAKSMQEVKIIPNWI